MVCKVCNTTIAKAPPAAIASSQLRRAIQIYTLYGTMRFRFTMLLAVSIVSSHINGLSAYGPLSRYSSCARTSSLSASNVRVNKVKQMMSLRSSDQNNISEKGSRNQKQPTLTIAFAIMITALSVFWSPSSALSLPSSIPCLSSSTIAISAIAVSSEPERWDSIKFLEEQDGGRLAKVYYSPDGKSASGTDINGKRFIAQLQAEPTGPPIILVPLILLGIGALAFSKSSEGQAIKAASLQQQVFSRDGSSNLQPTKVDWSISISISMLLFLLLLLLLRQVPLLLSFSTSSLLLVRYFLSRCVMPQLLLYLDLLLFTPRILLISAFKTTYNYFFLYFYCSYSSSSPHPPLLLSSALPSPLPLPFLLLPLPPSPSPSSC